MVKLSLTKQELDVVYYALQRFQRDMNADAKSLSDAMAITGHDVSKTITEFLKDSEIAGKLQDDCIKLMLSELKSNLNDDDNNAGIG